MIQTYNLSGVNGRVPEIESFIIKKEGKLHNLYGIMKFFHVREEKEEEVLVSFKAEGLRYKQDWGLQISFDQTTDYSTARDQLGNPLFSFLRNMTYEMLCKMEFTKEALVNNVLFEMTIINQKGDDSFMKYNIYENHEEYVVELNIAGVAKEDIRIIWEDELIHVKAYPCEVDMEDYEVLVKDFSHFDALETKIYLPNIGSIYSELNEGILTLIVEKKIKGIEIPIE